MPYIDVNGARLFYREEGNGPETIVFAHCLLLNHRVFDKQVAALKDRYRCIVFDFRGQGSSATTKTGYDLESLAEDTCSLIKAFNAAPCHLVGLSLGGFIALRVAIHHPELLRSLVLLGSSPEPERPENYPRFRVMNFLLRVLGVKPLANSLLPVLFSPGFIHAPERREELAFWKQQLVSHDRVGLARAVKGCLTRKGVSEDLSRITTPTLAVVGENDATIRPEEVKRMCERLKGATLVELPQCGHVCTVEAPQAITDTMTSFFLSLADRAK